MSTQKSIEEIVEEFVEYFRITDKAYDAGIRQSEWLRATLQSERDRAEEEKQQLAYEIGHLIEMKVIKTPEGKWDENEWNFVLMLIKDDLMRILKKYNIALNSPQDN